MVSLVMTVADLQEAVRELSATPKRESITLALHPARHRDGTEWLACRVSSAALKEAEGRLTLWTFAHPEESLPARIAAALQETPTGVCAGLGIGIGAQEGRVYGVAYYGQEPAVTSLECVLLVGPRMEHIEFLPFPKESLTPHWLMAQGLYSRVIGTLGMDTFTRLQRSRIALIGAGGNGSLMASYLSRFMGRESQLALIDPDRMELHNLQTWAFRKPVSATGQPGRYKAQLLAESLRTLPDPPEIEVLTASALDWSALAVLKRYDLVICCVDNPVARYAATFFSTLYMRPLLDIATGVFVGEGPQDHSRRLAPEKSDTAEKRDDYFSTRLPIALLEAGTRRMGADVRLIVPGRTDLSGNCLLCRGGIGDLARVHRELEMPAFRRQDRGPSTPFWEGRAGSLWMVNNEAVSLGLRLLLAFQAGELSSTQHWQMDETLATPPQWRPVSARGQNDCPLCKRSGFGDDAWRMRTQVLSEIES